MHLIGYIGSKSYAVFTAIISATCMLAVASCTAVSVGSELGLHFFKFSASVWYLHASMIMLLPVCVSLKQQLLRLLHEGDGGNGNQEATNGQWCFGLLRPSQKFISVDIIV